MAEFREDNRAYRLRPKKEELIMAADDSPVGAPTSTAFIESSGGDYPKDISVCLKVWPLIAVINPASSDQQLKSCQGAGLPDIMIAIKTSFSKQGIFPRVSRA